jgi:flagellum-specific peptidoglycan hydrolase FlgJ
VACLGIIASSLAGLRTATLVSNARGAGVAVLAVAPLTTSSTLGTADLSADTAPADVSDGDGAGQPDDSPVQMRSYVVQPGDTVKSIAQEFGVSNETIIWANDLTNPDTLPAGKKLDILPFSGLIHEVRPGDTVATIADTYDAKAADIISANRLAQPYVILVGQQIVVPGGYRSLPRLVTPADVLAPAQAAHAAPDEQSAQAAPSAEDDDSAQQVAASTGVSTPSQPTSSLGNTPQEQFIKAILPAALSSQKATGVPASVTIAQAILESFWGSSRLSTEAHNYFGIKADSKQGPAGVVWFDTWEVIGGRNLIQHAAFRAYHNAEESFIDHGKFFIENPRYAGAMAVRNDARAFARAINAAGYATDPAYSGKLIQLMDRYNLYQFDK